MACSKHTNYTHLDNFLEDIVAEYLNFLQSNLEVQVVQQLVHEMINNIVKEAYPPSSCLTLREVIPVGSMAEGTRINQPNEFDFMIVVDKFHADDITEITSNSEGTFVNLKTECRQENCIYGLKEPGFDYLAALSSGCNCRFAMLGGEMFVFHKLHDTVDKIIKNGRICSVEYFPGKLRMTDRGQNGPATAIKLLWETYGVDEEQITMEISVDLVPVIELEINEFFLDQLEVFHQDFYNKLKATKKVHMIHDRIFTLGGFHISFAFTEVQLIRDESETHKKCYKLLKYIYRTNDSSLERVCFSFMLKNFVLQHAVCCEGGGLGWCLLKILGDLRYKFAEERMEIPLVPHIFCSKKNLLRVKGGLYTDMDLYIWSYFRELWTTGNLRTYHKDIISEFIENLEKIRDRAPIPSSFDFWIPDHVPFSLEP